MNISISLKDILKFFNKLSFKLAFFTGIIIYKFFLLDKSSKIADISINIMLTISIIFLVDDIIERIIKLIKKKYILKKYIRGIKELSEPQIEILVSNYFEIKNNKVIINPTAYFSIEEGEYQILSLKAIIFRASSVQTSFSFPFTLEEWAYKELDKAIQNEQITYVKKKGENIVYWHGKEVKFKDKKTINYLYY